MRADIHDGQEHKRSVQGPDTEAQDLSPPNHHFPLATRGRSIQLCHDPTLCRAANSRAFPLPPRPWRTASPVLRDGGLGIEPYPELGRTSRLASGTVPRSLAKHVSGARVFLLKSQEK